MSLIDKIVLLVISLSVILNATFYYQFNYLSNGIVALFSLITLIIVSILYIKYPKN